MGLCVNFSYFLGYLLIVNNLYWVFVFTAKYDAFFICVLPVSLTQNESPFQVFGMLGIVNYPSISSVKSQKCSPAEQGQVLGSLSAIQSLSICIGPVK